MGQQKTQQLRRGDAASGVVTTGPQAACRGGLEAKPPNAKQLRSDRGNGISIVANRFGRRNEGLMPPPRPPVRRGACGQAAHREILHSLKTVSLKGDEDNWSKFRVQLGFFMWIWGTLAFSCLVGDETGAEIRGKWHPRITELTTTSKPVQWPWCTVFIFRLWACRFHPEVLPGTIHKNCTNCLPTQHAGLDLGVLNRPNGPHAHGTGAAHSSLRG